MRELLGVILGGSGQDARSTIGAHKRSWVSILATMSQVVHQGALPAVRAGCSSRVWVGFGGRLGVLAQNLGPILLQLLLVNLGLSLVFGSLKLMRLKHSLSNLCEKGCRAQNLESVVGAVQGDDPKDVAVSRSQSTKGFTRICTVIDDQLGAYFRQRFASPKRLLPL